MKTRRFVLIVICIVAMLIITGSCATKRIADSGVSAGSADFTFIGIADTHIESEYELDILRNFLYTVHQTESHDMILILGDLVELAPPYWLPRVKQVIDNSIADVRVSPGNRDYDLDTGGSWQEVFGELYYAFDHKGWKIIMNNSQNQPMAWLTTTLDAVPATTPVVFCQHFPVSVNERIANLLMNYPNVQVVLAGHIHARKSYVADGIPVEVLPQLKFSLPVGDYHLITAHDGIPFAYEKKQSHNLKLLSPPDDVPVISLTSQDSTSTMSGNVQFSGTVGDDSAVVSIQYRVSPGTWQKIYTGGGGLIIDYPEIGKWQDIPVKSTWDVAVDIAAMEDGPHVIEFRAIDNAGQESLYYARRELLIDR